MDRITVHIVPHSHWDREWYFSLEDSNVLLGENLSYLINVLENDKSFNSYCFDGQGSIVEEYLKVYPNNKERLSNLVKNHRLYVGPWYTQCDTLTINTESIVRNLEYGFKTTRELGHTMNIGYLPDAFGQNQYLPSIFNGFGIKHAIFQRGILNSELNKGLNLIWRSPDNKEVIANNIFLGYGPGKFLSDDLKYVNDTLLPMLDKLHSFNPMEKNILLPSGGDQVLVRKHFPHVIEEINKLQDKYYLKMSSYEEFVKTINEENLNIINNELVECQKSRIHRTIGSQRYDIKQANYLVENKLIYHLEPLYAIANNLGIKYPKHWIDIAWKQLFDVHAHDSISGCNSDNTNSDIMHRLQRVDRIVEDSINYLKKQITNAVSKKINKNNIIVLFNTDIKSKKYHSNLSIFTKKKGFILKTLTGKNIEYEVNSHEEISGGLTVQVTPEGEKLTKVPGYYKTDINILNYNVSGLGYDTLEVIEEDINICTLNKTSKIESNRYIVEVVANKINVHDKNTNKTYHDILSFYDEEDLGDSYDFSFGNKDANSMTIEVKESYRNLSYSKLELLINVKLYDEQTLKIYTTITLKDNQLIIKHSLNNNSTNHRLRARINTGIISKYSYANQGYSTIKRPVTSKHLNTWKEEGFVEMPLPVYNLENFVAIKDEKYYGVICEGIKEYEVVDNYLCLTLFRSTDVLGRDNLLTRPGRASGINNTTVYTKDALMQKEMVFEYTILLDEDLRVFYDITNKRKYTTCYYQLQGLNTLKERIDRFEIPFVDLNLDANYSILSLNSNLYLASVTYDNGLYLKLYNPFEKDELIELPCKFKTCNLLYKETDEQYVKAKSYQLIKVGD